MRASTICFLVLLLTATLVSSRPNTYLTHPFRALLTLSYKRQSSSVPSQCNSTCDPVIDEVNAGCPITACCTQSFETSSYNCLLCVGTALNVTNYTQAQADLDQLYVACYDNGYTLQELTFPGQNPSRTLSTSSPAGISTRTSPVSVSSPTFISKTTVLFSSISPTPSGTSTSANGTATPSTSTPTTSGAALGLSAGESGIWALAAAVIGLTIL